MNIYLCNIDRQRVCELNAPAYPALNVNEEYKLNEITTLSFEVPVLNPNYKLLANEQLVEFKNEYYIIKQLSWSKQNDGRLNVRVDAKHYSDILASDLISIDEIEPLNVLDLMKIALQYDTNNLPLTGWAIGNVTVDKTVKRGLEANEQSPFTILLAVAEKYEAYVVFNSKTMTVDMHPITNTSKPIMDLRVSKNLKSIEVDYDTTELVTRLYCYGGQNEEGFDIDIITVNPTEKAYIDNFDYFLSLGYTQQYIDSNKDKFVRTSIWRDTAYFDPSDLYTDGLKELKRVSQPKVNISIEALDVTKSTLPDSVSNLKVGDCIRVIDEDLNNLDILCNVVSRNINHNEPHILSVTIKSNVEYMDLIKELYLNASNASSVVTGAGNIVGNKVTGITTNQISDLYVKFLDAEQIKVLYLTADEIRANYLTADQIQAQYVDTDYLGANYATIGSLEALDAKIENLDVTELSAKVANIENLMADKANIADLDVVKADIVSLKAQDVTIDGKLTASTAEINNLKALKLEVDEFNAYKATVENLYATKATITELEAELASIDTALIDKATIADLNATKASIGVLEASLIEVEDLVATKANITDLNATNANITNLNAQIANINTALIDYAKITDLTALRAEIETLVANEITAVNAEISNIKANYVTTTVLNAQIANVNNLIATKANITDLNATNADIGELNAQVANIETIMSGAIGTGTLQAINITARNTVFENSIIKNAMIDTLDVSKINAGTISTNKFSIKSDDGGVEFLGSTQQFKDAQNRVRVQIGKDTQGNFNFILKGTDGTTTLIDHTGIKSGAIGTGLIVDNMINTGANISGSKININSVITEVNKAGTTQIKGTKIFLDEQNQSLQASFTQLNTTTSGLVTTTGELETTTQSLRTDLTIEQGKISQIITDTTIDGEKLKDKYLETVSTVDGFTTRIGAVESDNTTINSKLLQIDADVNGLTTTVSSNTSEIGAVKTTASQTASQMSWIVKSGTSETNFTLTDRTATLVADKINLSGLVTFSGLNSSVQNTINTSSTNASNALTNANNANTKATDALSMAGVSNTTINNWINSSIIEGQTQINGGYIQTGTISADKLIVDDLFANSSFINYLQTMEIHAEQITSGKIQASHISLEDLSVFKKDTEIVTFRVDTNGEVTVRGTMESYDYLKDTSGWAIKSDGSAEFNNITVRGNLIATKGGIVKTSGETTDVIMWAGSDMAGRHTAPFRVMTDGSVIANKGELGGVFTGEIKIGNIEITDKNVNGGNDAQLLIKNGVTGRTVVKLNDDESNGSVFAQTVNIADEFGNKNIVLNKDGAIATKQSLTVSDSVSNTVVRPDEIIIDGTTLSNVGETFVISSTKTQVNDSLVNGELEVRGKIKTGGFNFGGIVEVTTSTNGIDFNFIV